MWLLKLPFQIVWGLLNIFFFFVASDEENDEGDSREKYDVTVGVDGYGDQNTDNDVAQFVKIKGKDRL